jgi:cytochrome c5
MNKMLFSVTALSIVLSFSLDAASYKGQKEYLRKCRECHGGGQAVANSKTVAQWSTLLESGGKGLADLHVKNEKAKDSVEYFTGRYKKSYKDLKDFMVEYAKDSGNVPACN